MGPSSIRKLYGGVSESKSRCRDRRRRVAIRMSLLGLAMSGDFRLEHYLVRIGFHGTPKPDLATLTAIHAAQVDAICFDGLDPLLGRLPVRLDLASLQQKLVDSRRGGYCHEQNVLLKAALGAIGFKVSAHGGRVRWMSPPDAPL